MEFTNKVSYRMRKAHEDIFNLSSHQELNHQFIDEPLSISVHPTGIFVCISFWNIVRIYAYTIDRLTLFKELEIANARVVRIKDLI
jgi:hypothetical protein